MFGRKKYTGAPQYTDPSAPGYINPQANGTRNLTCPQCLASRSYNYTVSAPAEYRAVECERPQMPQQQPQGIPVEIPARREEAPIPVESVGLFAKLFGGK
jgi:hypothetical protein